MKRIVMASAFAGASISGAAVAFDGDPDPTFGTDGKVVVPINVAGSARTDRGLGSIELSGGGTLVVGTVSPDGPDGPQIACVRLTADGARDLSYGPNGVRFLQTQFDAGLTGLVSATEDTFVLYGSRTFPLATTTASHGGADNVDFWLHGVTVGCATHTSFGDGGTRRVGFDLGGEFADVATTAFMGDSPVRLFVAGAADAGAPPNRDFAIAAFDPGGNLLPSFAAGGRTSVAFDLDSTANADVPTSIDVRDGKVLVGGTARHANDDADMAFVRLLVSNGTLDATFCPAATCAGSSVTTPGKRTVDNVASAVTNESNVRVTQGFDGSIYVAGTSAMAAPPSNELLIIVKMGDDGASDANWGGGTGQLSGSLLTNTRPVFIGLLSTGVVVAGSASKNAFDAANPLARFFSARFSSVNGGGDPTYASSGSCFASFCATYLFPSDGAQPTDGTVTHVRLLDDARLLMTGSRLFERATGIEDYDFAVARTRGGHFLKNGFE